MLICVSEIGRSNARESPRTAKPTATTGPLYQLPAARNGYDLYKVTRSAFLRTLGQKFEKPGEVCE